jgi:hypothetical protein
MLWEPRGEGLRLERASSRTSFPWAFLGLVSGRGPETSAREPAKSRHEFQVQMRAGVLSCPW